LCTSPETTSVRSFSFERCSRLTIFLFSEHDDEDPYGDGELDSDEEGYDLDDVSSDVEMNPEDLEALELESNSRCVRAVIRNFSSN
jgi:hypothetical protein